MAPLSSAYPEPQVTLAMFRASPATMRDRLRCRAANAGTPVAETDRCASGPPLRRDLTAARAARNWWPSQWQDLCWATPARETGAAAQACDFGTCRRRRARHARRRPERGWDAAGLPDRDRIRRWAAPPSVAPTVRHVRARPCRVVAASTQAPSRPRRRNARRSTARRGAEACRCALGAGRRTDQPLGVRGVG